MKKRFLFLLLSIFAICSSFSQVSLDPNDEFYKDAKNWETLGIVKWLPQIRPYSIKTVKEILAQVKENGGERDIKKASYYEEKYFSKAWNVGFTLGGNLKASNKESLKKMVHAEPKVYGDLPLFDLVGLGYKLGVIAQNKSVTENDVLPLYYNSLSDTHDDPFTVGSIIANIDMAANITVGKENVYAMAGVNKIAYGPFLNDSVLLNGTQFHSANFSFIYEGKKWGYTQVFSSLSRSTKNDRASTSDIVPEKFMAFHTLRFTPIKQFAISYFESSVYTNRFDPSYFIPVPYMVIQGMYGASDNTISGLTFDVRPLDGLSFSLTGLIDDINLDGFAKGDFNTRFKFAMQTGFNFVPNDDLVQNISCDYTIVAPYTYSHTEPQLKMEPSTVSYYNKDNYTTRLTNLGTRLPPNSDKIELAINFTPKERLKIGLKSALLRHANIAESFNTQEALEYIKVNSECAKEESNANGRTFATDGSIWTSSMTSPSRDHNNFMNQEYKMYILQGAISASYELPPQKWGRLEFIAGYMLEYIHNKGVDSDIYTSLYEPTEQGAQQAKKEWVAKLHNVVNNYFSVSVKYSY